MPLYEYYHPATGECVETFRSVAERDLVPQSGFVRRTVPSRLGVVAAAAHLAPPSMREGVLRGYHQQEQREGSRFRSGFTKAQIKAAWDRAE